QLWTLFQDRHGLIWAPTQARSILKLNPATHQLTRTVDSALYGNINIVRTAPGGDTWIGHWSRGLIRIDRQTGKSTAFTKPPPPLVSPVRQVNSFYIDEDSIGWVGNTEQGLLRFDMKEGRYTAAHLFEEGNRGSISSNYITDILAYNKDTLLVGTNTGLNIFDKKSHVFTTISAQDGLPSNHIIYMMLDDHRRLWVACLKGFCRVDIPTRKIVTYDVNEGLPDEVFAAPMYRLRNGSYLVGQGNGFVAFNPDSVFEKAPPPNVTLTDFHTADRRVNLDSLVNTPNPLRLSYQDNNISIDFAALQFYGTGNIRYSYQLEGVDRYWISSGREQTARYNQLKGGEYTFRIKCVNRDGIPCEQETTLQIYIVPPFWQTWWFLLLVFIAVAALVFSIGRWLRDRKKEKEMLQLSYEKKLAVMEMNTLRAQMNPHFIFNSLNSINTFILKNDSENATEYLIKFSQLVRLILDNSRTEWVLLENELKALALYIELESLRLDNTFTHSITTDPEVLKQPVIIPPLIIQPYVENAIWHGLLNRRKPGGRMTVDIKKEDEKLIIQIGDNGIGREEAGRLRKKRQHKSHGMNITAERLSVVNEVYHVHADVSVIDLKDEAGNGIGTLVLLTIDYKTSMDIRY
ncbi:MAG TPA: histidine kinase, partial [Puia sp.]